MITHASFRRCAVVAMVALAVACAETREPILVEEGVITVHNLTSSDWKDVRITVNDHFNGGVPALQAGQRMNALLSKFQTAFGQPYDRGRMSVFKVEVTATDERGQPVKLVWGGNRSRQ